MAEVVRLGVFSPSVVLGVARTTGVLDRAGLVVEETPATSSAQQAQAMLAGELDAALTSPDNVMGYRGSVANPLGRFADIRILAAIDRGLGLSLFAGPGIELPAGGPSTAGPAVLAVDVATSGFAFVAYELLARRGLRAERDYVIRPMGTTPRRAAALVAGECALTVLGAGSDLRAEAAGCRRLARAASLGPYVGTALAAPGAGIEASATTLRRLTAAMVETGRALAGGGLRDAAAAVTAERLGLTGGDIARYLDVLRDEREGLVPDGHLDPQSLRTLLWLRGRHGGARPTETADPVTADPVTAGAVSSADVPSGLVDERFLAPST